MTGGRNWMTGEEMSIDDVWLHHIRHDSNGYTLYGGIYDSLGGHNFAALTKNQNEVDVERNRVERQTWEDRFIYMWECFKRGNFRAATEHWNDVNRRNQAEFLRDIRSRRYLDYWLKNI
jgi:hypothetical protein